MDLMYLKLQNKTIMSYDSPSGYFKIYNNELLPIILRDRITDTSDSEINPLNIVIKNQDTLSVFYMNRSLSIYRENAKYMLNELGISHRNDTETKKKMLLRCNALSAADDYWITENPAEK